MSNTSIPQDHANYAAFDETLNTAGFNVSSDLGDTSFNVILDELGQEGGYHTSNDLRAPFQRETVTERRGSVDIRCKSREIIHGKLGPSPTTSRAYLSTIFTLTQLNDFAVSLQSMLLSNSTVLLWVGVRQKSMLLRLSAGGHSRLSKQP